MTSSRSRGFLVGAVLVALVSVCVWWIDGDPRPPHSKALQALEFGEESDAGLREADVDPWLSADTATPLAVAERSSLTVRVEDPYAVPLADASVRVREDPDEAILTDAHGLANLEASSAATLVIGRDGFQTREVRLTDPVPRELTVRLEGAGSIAGVVSWASGRPAPAGIEVTAWSRGELLAAEGSRPGDCVSTFTDAGGSFELAGLAPGHRYAVDSGAPGIITRGAVEDVLVGTRGLEITIAPVYATQLQVVDARSGQPVDQRDAYTGYGLSWPAHLDGARSHWPSAMAAALGGVTFRRQAAESRSSGYSLLTYVGEDPEVRTLGPVPVTARLLGYEKATHMVAVPRVTAAGVGVTELPLAPAEDLSCDLELNLLGSHIDDDAQGRWRFAPGVLKLRESGSGELIECDVRSLSNGTQVLRGFPAGDYSCHLELLDGLAQATPIEGGDVSLSSGRQSLTFDLDPFGAVTMEVLSAESGRPWRGSLTVSCIDKVQGSLSMITLLGPPYTLPALRAGSYSLSATWPKNVESIPDLVVEAGRTTNVTLFRN